MKIIDEKLEPYQIHKEGNNYIVTEENGFDKNGKQVYRNHAYCTRIENALNKIAKMKVEGKDKDFDLSSYIKAITESNSLIKSVIINNKL